MSVWEERYCGCNCHLLELHIPPHSSSFHTRMPLMTSGCLSTSGLPSTPHLLPFHIHTPHTFTLSHLDALDDLGLLEHLGVGRRLQQDLLPGCVGGAHQTHLGGGGGGMGAV